MPVSNKVKKAETREVISTSTKVDGDKIVTTTRERVTTKGFGYDPATGTWPQVTKTHEEESSSTSSSNLKADSTDKDSAQGTNDAKANDMEMNTLSGTLSFIATPDTIQIKAGDTITLKGLGKYLSGDYYVQDVTRNISKDGYSHSATVIKTDFGTSLKSDSSTAKTKETSTSQSTGIQTTENGANFKTYTVKQGDTPYLVAKRELNDPSLVGRLFDAKTKERLDVTTQLKVGQEIIVDM